MPGKSLSWSSSDIGIDHISNRLENYATYLNKAHNRPVYIPFLAFATSAWKDENADEIINPNEVERQGWIDEAGRALAEIRNRFQRLHDAGVFGISAMMLFDDPARGFDGDQFFQQNEYAMGLVATSAKNGVPGEPLGGTLHFKKSSGIDRNFVELLFGDDEACAGC